MEDQDLILDELLRERANGPVKEQGPDESDGYDEILDSILFEKKGNENQPKEIQSPPQDQEEPSIFEQRANDQLSGNTEVPQIPDEVKSEADKLINQLNNSIGLPPEILTKLNELRGVPAPQRDRTFNEKVYDFYTKDLFNLISNFNSGAMGSTASMLQGGAMVDEQIQKTLGLLKDYKSPLRYPADALKDAAQANTERAVRTGVDQNFLTRDLPQGAGSLIPFVAGGIASGGSSTVTQVASGAMGSLMNIGGVEDEEGFKDLSEEQKVRIMLVRGGIGASEAFGMGKILGKFGKTGASNKLLSILKEGGEEALQEMTTETLNNITAQQFYDATREIFTTETLRAGGVGFVLGGFTQGLSTIAETKAQDPNISEEERQLYEDAIEHIESTEEQAESSIDQEPTIDDQAPENINEEVPTEPVKENPSPEAQVESNVPEESKEVDPFDDLINEIEAEIKEKNSQQIDEQPTQIVEQDQESEESEISEPETDSKPEKLPETDKWAMVRDESGKLTVQSKDGKQKSSGAIRKAEARLRKQYVEENAFDSGVDSEGFAKANPEYRPDPSDSPATVIVNTSTDPRELANAAILEGDKMDIDEVSFKQRAIADNMAPIKRKSLGRFGDLKAIGISMAKSYIGKKGDPQATTIDDIAQAASLSIDPDNPNIITPDDVYEFMQQFSNGAEDFYRQKNPDATLIVDKLEEVLGFRPNREQIGILASKLHTDEKNNQAVDGPTETESEISREESDQKPLPKAEVRGSYGKWRTIDNKTQEKITDSGQVVRYKLGEDNQVYRVNPDGSLGKPVSSSANIYRGFMSGIPNKETRGRKGVIDKHKDRLEANLVDVDDNGRLSPDESLFSDSTEDDVKTLAKKNLMKIRDEIRSQDNVSSADMDFADAIDSVIEQISKGKKAEVKTEIYEDVEIEIDEPTEEKIKVPGKEEFVLGRDVKSAKATLGDTDAEILIKDIKANKRSPEGQKIYNSARGKHLLSKNNSLLTAYRLTDRKGIKAERSEARGVVIRRVNKVTRRYVKSASDNRLDKVFKQNRPLLLGQEGAFNKYRNAMKAGRVSPQNAIEYFERQLPKDVLELYNEVAQNVLESLSATDSKTLGFNSKEEAAKAIASRVIFDNKAREKGEATNKQLDNNVEHVAVSEMKRQEKLLKEWAAKDMSIYDEIGDESLSGERSQSSTPKPVTQEQNLTKAGANRPGRIRISPKKGNVGNSRKVFGRLWRGAEMRLLTMSSRDPKPFGSYRRSTRTTKIKYTGDMDVAAHETGHALSHRYQLLDHIEPGSQAEAELDQFAQFGSIPPEGHPNPAAYIREEGVAEFIRALIANPEATALAAPELTKLYNARVPSNIRSAITEFSDQVRAWEAARPLERTAAKIDSVFDKEGSAWQKFVKSITPSLPSLDDINVALFDGMHKAFKAYERSARLQGIDPNDFNQLKPSDHFKILARTFLGFSGRFGQLMESGLQDAKGKTVIDEKTGKPVNFRFVWEPFSTDNRKQLQKETKLVNAYMVAQRTLWKAEDSGVDETVISGIGAGIYTDKATAEATLADWEVLRQEDPQLVARLEEAARRYRVYSKQLLTYQMEMGRISDIAYQEIIDGNTDNDGNDVYVAMYRVMEAVPDQEVDMNDVGAVSYGLTGTNNYLKKFKGSSRQIIDPYEMLVKMTHHAYREAERNHVVRSYVQMVIPDQTSKDTPQELVDAVKGLADDVTVRLPNRSTVAAKGANKDYVIEVYIDGEKKFYQLDPEIYDALTRMYSANLDSVSKAIRSTTAVIRNAITLNPDFAIRNFIRDTLHRIILSDKSFSKGGIIDTIKNRGERFEQMKSHGGAFAGYYGISAEQYIESALRNVGRQTKKKNLISLNSETMLSRGWEAYKKMMSLTENANRLIEYNNQYNAARKAGLSEYDASLYGAYKARELIDFAVSGTWSRQINAYVPFFNAALRGMARSFASASGQMGRPQAVRYWTMWGVTVLAPVMAMRYAIGQDDELEEEYRQFPSYIKDMFLNIPIPGSGKWVSIPMPHEMGVMGSIGARLAGHTLGDKKAFEGLGGTMASTFLPLDSSNMFGVAQAPIEAFFANYSFFRDKKIIPSYEEALDPDLRTGYIYGSRLGKAIANSTGAIGWKTDPRQWDHMVLGWGGRFGSWALKTSNYGSDMGRQWNVSDLSLLTRNDPGYNARDVQWVMEMANSKGLAGTKEYKGMSQYITAVFASQTDDQYKRTAKELRTYATKLRTKWEKDKPWEEKRIQVKERREDQKKANKKRAKKAQDKIRSRSPL